MVCAVRYVAVLLIGNLVLMSARQMREFKESIIPYGYDRDYAPSVNTDGNKKTDVWCELKTITIVDLSAKNMDLKIDAGFFISWIDNRLNLSHIENKLVNVTVFGNEVNDKLWYPKLRFGNCKECPGSIYDSRMENMKYDHIKHRIFVYVKHAHMFTCKFEMSSYPFDKQVCCMEIVKYNYQPITVDYKQYPNHDINKVNVPPEWTLVNITETRCPFDANVYGSCYSFNYHLTRNRARQILLIFMPSALIVIISFLSFWLEPSAAAPRVALGLTSLLTLTTQFGSAQTSLPAVSTVMALDIWTFACIFIISATLVEYAIVNFMNKTKPKTIIRRKPGNYYSFIPPDQITCVEKTYKIVKKLHGRMNPYMIDETSRILFPVTFIVFNLCFWITFYR